MFRIGNDWLPLHQNAVDPLLWQVALRRFGGGELPFSLDD